jgi:hypothetical protein
MRGLIAVVVAFVVVTTGCSGSPSAPTVPPAATTFTLSGSVMSSGAALAGATVLVLDGSNANRSTTTGSTGSYQLAGLQSGGFTIRVSAVDYMTTTQPVTLIANVVANVELVRLPRAVLENVSDVVVPSVLQRDGSWAFTPSGINTGNGCAGSVAGSVEFRSNAGLIKTISWSLQPTAIVRPGERFTYSVCCLTPAEAFSEGVRAITSFTYVTVPCS